MLTSLIRQFEVAGLHKQASKLLVGLLNPLVTTVGAACFSNVTIPFAHTVYLSFSCESHSKKHIFM